MSVVRCEKCCRQIDTDLDTECEVYVGNYKRLHATAILCEACREEHHRQLEHDADQASREPPT